MDVIETLRAGIVRLALIAFLSSLSGCAMLMPEPVEPVVQAEPEPVPEPQPAPQAAADPQPAPVPPVKPALPEPPEPIEPPVAVVLSNRTPAFMDVAEALIEYLDHHEIYDLSDRSLAPRDAFAAIAESRASAVVAIGLSAAKSASKYSAAPIVVSQVFNINAAGLRTEGLKAVGVLPPIEHQVEAWLEIDPTLHNVGAVLGPGHDELIAETDQALRKHGIKFHYAIANSDRETLYLYDRLVRDIDGFILFPDNRILSRNVLTEMMSTASRQRVQVAVFNEPLLEAGATFCAAAVESDIAQTIARTLNRILDGEIDHLPSVSPLSEARITMNSKAIRRLGLESADAELVNSVAEAK
jgi:ABC-type uncharacterized transport system substrate-binding protein